MSNDIEMVYDKYISEEKLKKGTKYEKLAAVVFKTLNQNDVVIHDLRLRGDGKKTAHQIDVTIEKSNVSKRILIECKEYDKTIGIGIIRDFYGAVAQIKPDEAFVITTKGYTKGARTFAEDESIKLAILREFKDEDWGEIIREVHITGKLLSIDRPQIGWVVASQQELDKFLRLSNYEKNESGQTIDTSNSFFYNQSGIPTESFKNVFTPIFNSFPRNTSKPTTGRYEFKEIKHVKVKDILLAVRGFDYEFVTREHVFKTIVNDGERVALLLFKILDETFEQIIYDQDLDRWTFDDEGKVIEKKGY